MDDRISGYSYNGNKKDYEAAKDGLGIIPFQHHTGSKTINNELKIQKKLNELKDSTSDISLLNNIKNSLSNGLLGTSNDLNFVNSLTSSNDENNSTPNPNQANVEDSDILDSQIDTLFPNLNSYDVVITATDGSGWLPFSLKFKDSSGNLIPLVNESNSELLYEYNVQYSYNAQINNYYGINKSLDNNFNFSPYSPFNYSVVSNNSSFRNAIAFNLPPNVSLGSLEILSNQLYHKPNYGSLIIRIKGNDYSFDYSSLTSNWFDNPLETPTFSTNLN